MSSPRCRRRCHCPSGRGVGGVPDASKQGYDNIITKEVVLGEVMTNIMSARARWMSDVGLFRESFISIEIRSEIETLYRGSTGHGPPYVP